MVDFAERGYHLRAAFRPYHPRTVNVTAQINKDIPLNEPEVMAASGVPHFESAMINPTARREVTAVRVRG